MARGRLITLVVAVAFMLAPIGSSADEIGITPDTITIGLHASLTNAGLNGESLAVGKDLYWRFGDHGGPVTIAGRGVNVVFRDDQYNPSHAVQVCRELGDQAFLLVGIGEADQMQACARYADMNGIPYVSPGSTEKGFRDYANAFAASMSFAQQAPLVAQYIKNVLGITDPGRVAAVITDTGNFDDASAAFTAAFPDVKVFRPSKADSGGSMAGNLCSGPTRTYDAVFPLTSPAYFLQMRGAASCGLSYVGVGMTMGLDQIADIACSSSGGGNGGGSPIDDLLSQLPVVGPLLYPNPPLDHETRFLSPAPAFEDSDTYDPDFRSAAALAGVEPDDIMWILWGLSKTLHAMLSAPGPSLDRPSFLAAASTLSASTGVFPDVTYTSDDHFGARQAHMLKMVCESRNQKSGHFVTERAFVESF